MTPFIARIRPATTAEIEAEFAGFIRCGAKVEFEIYPREAATRRSSRGVRRIMHNRSKLRFADGKVFGRDSGRDVELIADHVTGPDGKSFVACLRMKGLP